jgi:hypothetical protein
MKKKQLITILAVFFLQSCGENTSTNSNFKNVEKEENKKLNLNYKKEKEEYLQNFYKQYLNILNSEIIDFKKLDRLVEENTTDSIFAIYYDEDIDYDIFLNSQDYDESWGNLFKIKQIEGDENNFLFEINNNEVDIKVKLKLIQYNNEYKICDISYK